MKNYRTYLVAVTLMLGVGLLYANFVGGSSNIPDAELPQVVFVDPQSGEVFLLPARSFPEYHPITGEQTLIPGMYCEQCKTWRAVGSLEMIQRKRAVRQCPIHKTPLIPDGPLPDEPRSE